MTIIVKAVVPSISVPAGQPIEIKMEDSGRARVSMNFSIGDQISIDFDDTWSGSRTTTLPPMAKSALTSFAFVYVYQSMLGSDYAARFFVNGVLVAESHGTLASGVSHDGGHVSIPFNVV